MGAITRFLPVVDLWNLPTSSLNAKQLRKWAVLDTFDMFSPMHDHPKSIKAVTQMFQQHGANVTFADFRPCGNGFAAAVVNGVIK